MIFWLRTASQILLLLAVCALAGCKTSAPSSFTPHLTEPLKFNDFTVSELTAEGASNLLTAKVYIGMDKPDATDYDIFVMDDDTNRIHVETVQQYRAIKTTKAYAPTTADMVMQDWFEQVEDVLEFMQKAKESTSSFLGPDFLKNLPVTILESGFGAVEGDFSDKYGIILKADTERGKTIQDYASASASAPPPLQKLHQTGHTLTFFDTTIGIDYYIKELARGDFNGDGVEDALVSVGWHTQGTMGGAWTCVVTRTNASQHQLQFVSSFLPCRQEVTLAGTIRQKTFPGPPNYESIQKGDAAENYLILELNDPVNVDVDPEYPVSAEDKKLTAVTEMQLVVNDDSCHKFLNQKVRVTGSLWHGFTVHHKTPVLLDVTRIEATN